MEIKKKDRVLVKRGVEKGNFGTVTEVTSAGMRVGVLVDGRRQPLSLAVTSVEKI